jgi:hypothetical protein
MALQMLLARIEKAQPGWTDDQRLQWAETIEAELIAMTEAMIAAKATTELEVLAVRKWKKACLWGNEWTGPEGIVIWDNITEFRVLPNKTQKHWIAEASSELETKKGPLGG